MINYRSILLDNCLAKHHHAFLRSQLLLILQDTDLSCQCSGRPHRGADIASLCARAHCAVAKQRGRTGI